MCYKLSVESSPLRIQTVCMTSKEKFLAEFGKRIAEIRRQGGLIQEQLAEKVGLHRTYIGFIEQGKRNPSIGNIYKISRTLKISLKDLFSRFN